MVRAERPGIRVPGLAVRHPAHARAQHVAVREHDLEAARGLGMLPVQRVAATVLERVPDDAAPADIRDRRPELVTGRLQVVVQVEEAHTRLDERVCELLVHLQHLIHLPQADEDRPAHTRRGAAVRVVPALPERPQRNAELVCDSHDGLHILDRPRRHHGRGGVLIGPDEVVRVPVLAQVIFGGEDRIRAQSLDEGLHRTFHRRVAHTAQNRRHLNLRHSSNGTLA